MSLPKRNWGNWGNWGWAEIIGLLSLLVAIIAFATPEVRCILGLRSEACPPKLDSEPTSPPLASITDGPSRVTRKTTATFTFHADSPNARIECKLDGEDWKSCRSPRRYERLQDGEHKFFVRALDATGKRPLDSNRTINNAKPSTFVDKTA